MVDYWIPKAIKSKSSLRKQLHVPEGQKIDESVLHKIREQKKGTHVRSHGHTVTITTKLKKRAVLALTLKKMRKKAAR